MKKGFENRKKAIFMGYDRKADGYRLWDEETDRLVVKNFITYCQKYNVMGAT